MSESTPGPALPFRFVGRPVKLTFVNANTDVEVRHGAGEVPDGFLVTQALGSITRAPLWPWATKTLATLRSSVANNEAILYFIVQKEDPIDVNP